MPPQAPVVLMPTLDQVFQDLSNQTEDSREVSHPGNRRGSIWTCSVCLEHDHGNKRHVTSLRLNCGHVFHEASIEQETLTTVPNPQPQPQW